MLVHELVHPVTAARNYLAATQRLLTDEKTVSNQAREAVESALGCLARAADLMGSVKDAAARKAFRPRPVQLRTVVTMS
jgi:C4-dicarboxylate-specific signal transduction histidine kinase